MRPRLSLMPLVVLLAASQAFALELVRGGKQVARIVVAADAPQVERFAASELQAIVARLSGARVPIAADLSGKADAWVLIGEAAARLAGQPVTDALNLDEVRDDGYAVATADDGQRHFLALVGKEPRGTLFAVYNLLETAFGCGFFSDGDRFQKQENLAIYGLTIVGNPAFPLRACWVPTRYYGPKRFHATLWNAEDWKRFLRWMARKKLNCLAVEFAGETRAWGSAFDKAFPEARQLKREVIPPADPPPVPGPTARMGWGLHPDYQTALLKDVFAYARQTLGIQVLYILHVAEYELPLKLAQPNLKWVPAAPRDFLGVAGQTAVLSPSDPKAQEIQSRLWQAIIQTYGTDHLYAIDCHSHRNVAGTLRERHNPVLMATDVLRKLDPKARLLVTSADEDFWGETQEQKTEFLERLPDDVAILYTQVGFPTDALYRATDRFGGHAFHYASLWGESASDLLEYCFDPLRTQSYHMGMTPPPKAAGYFHWSEIRGTNPLMDNLAVEYAWTGRNTWRSEGGSNNPQTRLYLGRRYRRAGWWPIAEAYKQALRGAPRGDEAINYRAYSRWADVTVRGTSPARAGLALLLGCAELCKDSAFYEPDLIDFGRNYLHQYIAERYAALVALVRKSKGAARDNAYGPDVKARSVAQLNELEKQLLAAHTALTRLIAARQDMCLDDAILEATRTKGANKHLAAAIREQQGGAYGDAVCLVDTIEYHQQLKKPQIQAFLKYARAEVHNPNAKPIPSWQEFALFGVQDFIHKSKPVPYAKKAEKAKPSAVLQDFLKLMD